APTEESGQYPGWVMEQGMMAANGPAPTIVVDEDDELFLTNTFVPIMLAKAALGRLGEGGAIVNISGVIAEQNLPGMAAYGASKAAIRSFDEAFGREARRKKVRVLDARPPHTETGLVDRSIEGDAPRMPEGMAPEAVAATICQALTEGAKELPSSAF
ncbi:MAG: SDR family NAD(P)-dependent oxidoreductase, partial [Acidimicrobiales bacterium]